MASRRAYFRGSSSSRSAAAGVVSRSHRAVDTDDIKSSSSRSQRTDAFVRPPAGVRGSKAWNLVRASQQRRLMMAPQHGVANNGDGASPSPPAVSGSSMLSVTGKFARPLQPVPGEVCKEDRWGSDLSTAPVAMQVQEILGNRFQDSIGSSFSFEDFRNEVMYGKTRTASHPVSCASSAASLPVSGTDDQVGTDASSSTDIGRDISDDDGYHKYLGIVYLNPPDDNSSDRKDVTSSTSQLSNDDDHVAIAISSPNGSRGRRSNFSLRSLVSSKYKESLLSPDTDDCPDMQSLAEFPALERK